MIFIKAFLVGGAICALSQILIDKTRLTPARILSFYAVLGVVLTAAGVYGPFVEWAGCGATVPILGFGYTMAQGAREAVGTVGFTGALSGGLSAASAGIAAAVTLSFLASLVFRGGNKR
ncbi:MAG: SpoVA/SpoVAEb family sporulation membrane protein [Clostridia bacterium]|nr:SpoVA/SpoVAEb family sporulation membrane protein [Clostridia bacterium]